MKRKRRKRKPPSSRVFVCLSAQQAAALSGPGLPLRAALKALIERATGLPCPPRGRPKRATL